MDEYDATKDYFAVVGCCRLISNLTASVSLFILIDRFAIHCSDCAYLPRYRLVSEAARIEDKKLS